MAWKVLITDGLEKNGKAILTQNDIADDKKGIEAAELLQIIPEYDAIILRGRTKMTAEVIAAAARLKVIGRMGVGVDNIDLNAAKAHKVTVVNAAVATTLAVAELTIGMMFALAREIPRADASMKAEQWLKKDFTGIELAGKTLGIVGFGNIGQAVAKIAGALGMKVISFSHSRDAAYMRERGVEHVSLDELLEKSDVISIHTALTDQNRHQFDDALFAKMKDGVLLVDAARGGIVDEAALLRALESGKVRGAALDVFEKEPPLSFELIKHPKVIATPHIGAQTGEAQLRAAEDISSEVLNALNGLPLRWKIC
ncbi:MAG TPA: hydroxyacid dehydrogenase [Anaerolineaceae bacterium]|jgi:D-3-phosphoglycerate dehydrogenase|nr:hydroxyacid dehydrogenase [Anaerolineaceae bacterium]HPY33102.1 hydroxyacid dehydrogenase [Anaerolineaceae bacterium]HQK42235.1 hydroxyacid dehydrogenase [Anaerolineaceae bacterium]